MIISHCDCSRDYQQQTIYSGGEFAYRYESDFAKNVPAPYNHASVAGGCTDAEGNVYLAGRMSPASVIIKLDPQGNFVKAFGQDCLKEYVHFICCSPEGTLLCADTEHHVVQEFDQDGRLIRMLGNYDRPSDSGFDLSYYKTQRRQGFLFPTEPDMIIDKYWERVAAMQLICRVAPPFNMPTGVDLLSDGSIVVSDGYGNHAVHIFSRDGRLQKTFGGHGVWTPEDTPGAFQVVHGMCTDNKDHIWVADREAGAVHVFDRDGNVIAYCSGCMGQPSGVDCDGQYVYVIGRGGYLTIFDMDGNLLAQLGTFNCDLRAHDIAASPNGDLFLFPTHANEDHQCIALHRIR